MRASRFISKAFVTGIGQRPLARAAASGFTLVELIVVILIVAVVFVLSLAGISKGLERVNSAKCASNLKQIGSMIVLYAQDHNGMMPPATLNAATVIWYREIYPYAGITGIAAGQGVFKCPAKTAEEGTGHSYGLDYSATLGGGASPPGIKLAKVMTPGALSAIELGQRWMLIDASWYFVRVSSGSSSPAIATRFRHSERANVLLADMSVRQMKKAEVNADLYLYKSYPIP